MFQKEVYVHRRKVLREKMSTGILLFLGNDDSSMNYKDNTYPFRQHSSFLYYFGIDMPKLAAVIDLDNDEEIIFGDDPSMDEIVWTGHQEAIIDKCEKVGISTLMPSVKLYTMLREAQAAGRTIHFLPPYRSSNKIKLLRLLNIRPDQFKAKASDELVKAVVSQREIKSEVEITELRHASDLTVDLHIEAMKLVRPGIREVDVVAQLSQKAMREAHGVSYPTIGTTQGHILHNHSYTNTLQDGQLFLLDAGIETNRHYAGDMSSTMPVSATFSDRQKAIYEITLDAYKNAVNMLAPGVPYMDIHNEACRTIFQGLKVLGLTKGDASEAVELGAHALFFPCGTGHQIGLDVHDMEDLGEIYVGYDGESKPTSFGLKSLRMAKPLKAGMAVTVEPGIYFIPELFKQWKDADKFTDFINYDKVEEYLDFTGIRNEEAFLITDSGYERLSKPKPIEIADIEAIKKG